MMTSTTSISHDIRSQRGLRAQPGATTGFLVLDTESVPNGDLLRRVKYPDENLTPDQAVDRAQSEAREQSYAGSDFLPVTFQCPVAVCVLRVADDFTLQALACLDAPQFRTEEIVQQFWRGVAHYPKARLVTFNGRGFDLPLLELAAFDYGCCARDYFQSSRGRYNGFHIDLLDWITNYSAFRMIGGLNNLAKRLHGDNRKRILVEVDGPPGKTGISGAQVLDLHRAGRLQEINDYCLWDTLDTYFVFLRTRLLTGDLARDEMKLLVRRALDWLQDKATTMPAVATYLEHWKPLAEPVPVMVPATGEEASVDEPAQGPCNAEGEP